MRQRMSIEEPKKADRESITGIAECIGLVLAETIACGLNPERDTGGLREGWRNLATKVIDFAESED